MDKRRNGNLVRVRQLELVHWDENITVEGKPELKHPLLLFALGEDGVVYQLMGGKWRSFPIEPGMMHEDSKAFESRG